MGTWQQIGGDINGDTADDLSGTSLSLSADGSIVAIGATGYDEYKTNRVNKERWKNDVLFYHHSNQLELLKFQTMTEIK